MTNRLHNVPPVRGAERGEVWVPSLTATRRDIRWQQHTLRGTAAAGFLILWLLVTRLNVVHMGDDPLWVTDVPLLAVVLWWWTGVAGAVRRSVKMGRAMGAAVADGVAVWRAMPDPDREHARPMAAAMVAAGARHDIEAVALRLAALDRAAIAAQRLPGWDDDIVDVDAYIAGVEEARRGPWLA